MEEVQKIALFIDAENISAKYGKLIMENLENRGEIFIRRIYGNWEKPALRKWNDTILQYGLRTVHQIDFASGKNAADMSLTVDAMDVLYTKQASTFAIVSNDSDFTPLAVRLREYGIYVIGIGRKDSSTSFRSACSEYISLDSIDGVEVLQLHNEMPVVEEISLADKKILELEQKIFDLERKLSTQELPATFRLTAAENRNSALNNSVGKIKQKISFKTPFVKAEEILPVEEILPAVEIVETVETAVKVEIPATSDEIVKVELTPEIPAQIETVDVPTVQISAAERKKALNERLSKCGQNGMRNPKKKMQQIHDSLHESAKLHGDKNGFVPLSFAGQDIKKKNLGFSVQDFGYTLLNEFIGDFPEFYELTRTKLRSFRYRCIDV